jgi:FG-GAP-like repeat
MRAVAYVPSGNAFRVNTQPTGDQEAADVAVLSNGGFVVVWEDNEVITNGRIKAQLYDALGHTVGSEFLVNTQTSSFQFRPAITALSGGGFVVAWSEASGLQTLNRVSVQAQVFDAAGNKIGSELLVTQATSQSQQSFAALASLTSGGFVATWLDVEGKLVKAQIFDASGSRVGGELTVSTLGFHFGQPAAVAGLANGGFVIAFENGKGGFGSASTNSIKVQFFDAAGATVGGELLANTTPAGIQGTPDIAVLNDGHVVIVWREDFGGIKAQLFDTTGLKIGTEFQINTKPPFGQQDPSIAALSDGGFIVSWADLQQSGPSHINAQVFDAAGAKVGSEFVVTPPSSFSQINPAIIALHDGGLAVTWSDFNVTLGDTDPSSVQAQLYQFVYEPKVHWAASVVVGPHPAGWLPSGIGDFNNDATSDLAWYNASTGNLDIWKLSNGQWAGSADVGSHPAGYQPAGFGDFDHDGTADVIWFNQTTRNVDLWKLSNGQWAGSVDIGTHPAGWLPSGVGDFNGDGTSDILWYNASTRNAEIWKISNGQWAGSVDVGVHPAGHQPALTGDFNGDGTSDIAWYSPTTGDVDIWKIANGQWAGSVSVGAHPTGWQPLGAADFNLDGTSDIAWYNPATNNVDVWLIKNGQWAGSFNIGSHPAGAVAVGVGDFDHNGVGDIMWRDTATGHIENWMLAYS